MDGKLTSTKSRGENKAKVRQLQNKIQKGEQANRPSKFEKKILELQSSQAILKSFRVNIY